MLIATVVPDVTGLDKSFDYLVPDDLHGVVRVGSQVRVVLHGRRVGGWIVRLDDHSSEVTEDRLATISQWTGHGPSVDVIELAPWAAHRWGVDRLRPFLVAASPSRRVRSIGAAVRRRPGPLRGASLGVRALLADGGG
ncbi:MAG: hypothetical protein ACOYL9_14725, partial [Ilumatobacteraceae bacterium]